MTTTGAILLRVSRNEQASQGHESYGMQLKECLDYAQKHDIIVPDDLRWQEVGKRDQYYRRDGLQAALAAVAQRRYTALIVWRLDRLTDDMERFWRILNQLKEHGALPWSATEPDVDLSTPLGVWYVHTKLQFQVGPERKTTALRTTATRRNNTENGRPYASHSARYGYRWVVDMSRTVKRNGITIPLKERLEPDPETAPVVVQMYIWIDAGKTLKWVARALSGKEDGGIHKKPTPRQHAGIAGSNDGGDWSEGSIAKMLAFPGYKGKWPAYRTERDPGALDPDHPRRRPRDESGWVWIKPSPAPALVTPEKWHRVQQVLTTHKEYSQRNSSNKIGTEQALLHTGMARCEKCGGPMSARPRGHEYDDEYGNRQYQYQCYAARKNFPACQGVFCATEPLDRAVQVALVNTLRDPQTVRRLAQRSQDHDRAIVEGVTVITPLDEYDALKKALADMERDLIRTVQRSAAYADDDPRGLGYRMTIEVDSAKVNAKKAEVEQARQKAEKYQRVEQVIGEWEDYLQVARDNLDVMGDPYYLSRPSNRRRHRSWLEMLGARVIVHPYTTVRAGGPLATLRLHLTRLDLGATLPLAGGEGALEVPVVPVAPEPLRHGGYPPYWRQADYVEPAPMTEAEWAEREAQVAAMQEELTNPAKVAATYGVSLEVAQQYIAWDAAQQAEFFALPTSEERRE